MHTSASFWEFADLMYNPQPNQLYWATATLIEVNFMVKSLAAVIGAYLLSVILVIATDPLLSRVFPGDFVRGHIPSNNALMASTAFFIVVSILCAWVCARFAPTRPGKHVLWFFILGEVMGIAATIPNWSKGWPHWYWLSWLLTWPISCWIGLLIGGRKADQATATV